MNPCHLIDKKADPKCKHADAHFEECSEGYTIYKCSRCEYRIAVAEDTGCGR